MTILSGSDVRVFAHGDNARESELMVEYGMPKIAALKSATFVAGRVLRMDIGQVKAGSQPTSSQLTAIRSPTSPRFGE